VLWDPYDILQIPEVGFRTNELRKVQLDDWSNYFLLKGTELPEIKKTYRKLSLVYHPDKAPKDQAEEYEAKFVEITKAYKV
jgi:translocation protein SEC63